MHEKYRKHMTWMLRCHIIQDIAEICSDGISHTADTLALRISMQIEPYAMNLIGGIFNLCKHPSAGPDNARVGTGN